MAKKKPLFGVNTYKGSQEKKDPVVTKKDLTKMKKECIKNTTDKADK